MAKKENTIPTIIDTPEALTAKIAAMKEAQKIFATFTQEQVDKIFKAAATAADKARIPLAKDAVEETGMGIVEDKVIKNHYAAEYVYNAYKNTRTCGVIEEDTAYGIKKIAEPIGLIAAVIPTTNPTSTAIFKTLIALKTRNAIIISPHPRAKKCTIEAAKVVLEAAVEAGAPEGIIGWIDVPSLDLTNQVMREALKSNNDYSEEFAALKQVYDNYIQAKVKIQSSNQFKTRLFQSLPFALPGVVGVVIGFLGKGSPELFGLSLFITICAPTVGIYLGAKQSAKIPQLLQDLTNQFKIDYVCPKCGTFLGEIPWESLHNRKQCPMPSCKAKWVSE